MNIALKHTAAEEALLAMAGSADAIDQLRSKGLPTRRVEAWHYTDLRNLLKIVPAPAGPVDPERAAARLGTYQRLTNAIRLPFVNGSFLSAAADEPPAGVEVAQRPDDGTRHRESPARVCLLRRRIWESLR